MECKFSSAFVFPPSSTELPLLSTLTVYTDVLGHLQELELSGSQRKSVISNRPSSAQAAEGGVSIPFGMEEYS